MVWAAIHTDRAAPFLAANSSVHRTAAAAPQVGGQHWYRVSGSNTSGDCITSSRLSSWVKMAYGFFAACLRALTETWAKVSFLVPYFQRYSRPAPPNICAAGGAWLKPCTLLITAACCSTGLVRSVYLEPSAPFSIFSN